MITKILKGKPECKRSVGRPIKSCKDQSVICIVLWLWWWWWWRQQSMTRLCCIRRHSMANLVTVY
jgi:hypothetical protein